MVLRKDATRMEIKTIEHWQDCFYLLDIVADELRRELCHDIHPHPLPH